MKAGPVYRHSEARNGDCYVLDPDAWNRGERVVIRVIPAKNPPVKRPPKAPEPFVRSPETHRIVTWERGRAFDFKVEDVPVRPSEPVWAARARELKAAGWSQKRTMAEIGIKSVRYFREIMNKRAR